MISMKYDHDALRRSVRMALDWEESLWYRSILRKDFCGCALSNEEEHRVVNGAVRAATDIAQQIKARYGLVSPQGPLEDSLLKSLGLRLVHTTEELAGPFLYIGLYEPDRRTITMNDSAILLLQQFIGENGLAELTPPGDIIRVALFHEIFHALEDVIPDIYTRSRMVERRMMGIFHYKRGLDSASEIGAVHFSKCMTDVAYSPCIYERYLLLALGRLSIDFLTPNV